MSYIPIPGAGCGLTTVSGAYYPHPSELASGSASVRHDPRRWPDGLAVDWRNREAAIFAARSGCQVAIAALRSEVRS